MKQVKPKPKTKQLMIVDAARHIEAFIETELLARNTPLVYAGWSDDDRATIQELALLSCLKTRENAARKMHATRQIN